MVLKLSQKAQFGCVLLVLLIILLIPLFVLANEISTKSEQVPLKIFVVSPSNNQSISNSGIIIVVIEPVELVSSAWFEVGNIKGLLSKENNFSADFDSTLLPEGVNIFSVHACSVDNCSAVEVPIIVKNKKDETILGEDQNAGTEAAGEEPANENVIDENAREPVVEPPQQEYLPEIQEKKKVKINGSNLFSPLTLFNKDGTVANSGVDFFDADENIYDARIDFLDSRLASIELNDVVLDSNGVLVEVDGSIDPATVEIQNYEVLSTIAINPVMSFSSGKMEFNVPQEATKLFRCAEWNFSEKSCNGSWEKIAMVKGLEKLEVQFLNSGQAYSFTRLSSKKIRMLSQKDEFSLNEKPEFEVFIEDFGKAFSDGTLNRVTQVFLRGPGGREELPPEQITEQGDGTFSIVVERTRKFAPGIYKLIFETEEDNETVEQEFSFKWGLVSVNTRKSIYKPGEEAELIIVVLNGNGSPVCGAEITAGIEEPGGAKTFLSTESGTIMAGVECGLYDAKFVTKTEGTHKINVVAVADGVRSSFETDFLVMQNYDFDIIRTADSKIDPTISNSFTVRIDVSSFTSASSIQIKEYVPKEFNISTDATIEEIGNAKVLSWNKDLVDGKTYVEYLYSVPSEWPRLYELGRLEISYDGKSFSEARYWHVAVDPIETTVFHFRNPAEYNYSEPAPNDAISGETFVGTATESIFGMHPSTGTTSTGVAKVLGSTVTGNYKHSLFVSPPLTAQSIAAGNWTINIWGKELTTSDDATPRASIWVWADSNDNKAGPIVGTVTAFASEWTTALTRKTLTVAGSAITINKKDKIVVEIDNRGLTPATGARVDYNFGNAAMDGNVIFAGAPIALYAEANVPSITTPGADNNTGLLTNTNFLVTASTACSSSYFDCGDTNVSIQWCSGENCSDFVDVNSTSGAIQLVSGANPPRDYVFNSGDTNTTHQWVLKATQGGTYELRVRVDGNNTDANYSSGTDRTMVIQAPADYSFALNLPLTSCTQGKGSIDAGTTCDRGYFETTDLSGLADQLKVDPDGQTSTIPFFVYDNQSGSNDMNFTLALDAPLPPTLKLKVSQIYGGWATSCTGDTKTNCVEVSTSATNIGKAVYSAGTQDLNIFIWADFVAAEVGSTDRNVTSTSIAS